LLADLNTAKQQLSETQNNIQKDRETAQKLRRELEIEREKFKETESNILQEIRSRLVRDGDELQREIRDAMSELKKNKSQEKLEQAQKALNAMREQLKGKNWKPATTTPEEQEATFVVGQKVWLSGMGVQGVIVTAADSNGQLEVQLGNTKIKISPENLEKAKTTATKQRYYGSGSDNLPRRVASLELDLRGRRADEVEYELEAYLNDASMANLTQVRIIHGVATGVVRDIVRAYLTKHPLVQSFSPGKKEEGGEGVTMVRL
jgi:DNA mismatch repair protein MutS2